MAEFALSLFGGFDLRGSDGAPVPLSSAKAKALLAYLAAHPGRAVPRAKIATLLWADRGDEQARASLRQTLSVLRRALGDAGGRIVVSSAGSLSLERDAIEVDVAAFEGHTGSGTVVGLERAAGLYRGPFLDGTEIHSEPFEEWLRGERARLRDRAAEEIANLLDLGPGEGDGVDVLALSAKLLKLDPLREDIHRALMRRHRDDGNWNEAIRQFKECEAVLEAELGIVPGTETRSLHDEILKQRETATQGRERGPSADLAMPALGRHEGRPSIAVMPFDNLVDDHGDGPGQSYFSDGITEDIITELSRFPGLFVIARNSSFSYKGSAATPQDVWAALGVQYVVKGSVRKSGSRVRLAVQLIEAESGKHVWAERYDRELTDVFELQDELTRGIVGVLPGRIESFEARKVARKPPHDMAAYELLLAGKIHHHRFTKEDCAKALERLDRAIALDPEYAAAHAWKACVLGQALGRGFMPDSKTLFEGAVEAVGTALRLDENEVEAHRVQAEIDIESKRLSQAERNNGRALSLNPNDPRLVAQKGELLTWQGRAEEGADWLRQAMRLDPYSASVWAHLMGRALMMSGRYAEAAEAYLGSAFPRFGYHADAAGCYAKLGSADEAAAQAEAVLRMKPDFTISSYVAGLPYENEANRERHRDILAAAPLPP